MTMRQWALAITSSLCFVNAAFCQDKLDPVEAAIRKLGSSSFVQRELAGKQLEAIGVPALDSLKRAAKSADAETKRRLETLIQRAEEQLLTKQILTPKEVHLKLEDATVPQAIAELSRISGYPIQFLGDGTKVADNKITLDTGVTTFWQAFDLLNQKAGLVEKMDFALLKGEMAEYSPIVRQRIGVPSAAQHAIQVTPGLKQNAHVSYAGALRTEIRLSRTPSKQLALSFILSAEPRLLNSGIAATPKFEMVAMGQSRHLRFETMSFPGPKRQIASDDMIFDMPELQVMQAMPRVVHLSVQEADARSEAITELSGKLTVQLDQTNEVLAKITNVLEAAGKSAEGKNGGVLRIGSIKKQANGNFEVQVAMENFTGNALGGNVIINGGGNIIIRGGGGLGRILGNGSRADLPDLIDASGQKFKLAAVVNESTNINNASISRNAAIIYSPNAGQTAPSELVLFGARTHTIAVPFRFENVNVP